VKEGWGRKCCPGGRKTINVLFCREAGESGDFSPTREGHQVLENQLEKKKGKGEGEERD